MNKRGYGSEGCIIDDLEIPTNQFIIRTAP